MALSFAIFVVFFSLVNYVSSLLESNEKFLKLATEIEKNNEKLNSKILQTTFYLYANYDEVAQSVTSLKESFAKVKSYDFIGLNSNYEQIQNKLEICEKLLISKEEKIQSLLRYNSSVKHISMAFPRLVDEYRQNITVYDPKTKQILADLSELTATLLIARSSLDNDFLIEIKNKYENLKVYTKNTNHQQATLESLQSLLQLFISTYPKYTNTIQALTKNDMGKAIGDVKTEFLLISNGQNKVFYSLAFIVAMSLIGGVAAIVVLIIKLEKENKEMKKYQDRLDYSLKHDILTGLLNRNSFEGKQKELNSPIFLLVNIDRFKNINDFYGLEAGDIVLKQVANDLLMLAEKYYEKNNYIYRLGGDDFGILLEKTPYLFSVKRFAYMLIEHFENKVLNIRDIFEISVSVSVSSSNITPLFETSDMALKYGKQHASIKYIEYDDFAHNETLQIANNLSVLSMIKNAIKDNRIVPFFQPIYDVKLAKINKYESLVRIIETDGGIVSPGVFLDVAKQSKLYRQIAKIMIHKTFTAFEGNDLEFSINLTYEDINDEEISILIENQLFVNASIAHRVIFEITESESVEDYNILYNFIHKFKVYGCRFAIDDFGSGYSNFDKILQLEVDYIKIDGSLIKDINENENSKLITQMMVDFAKIKNIKTIAEFVSSESILQTLSDMNVDYLQGFHLGKPAQTLLT